MWEGVQFTEFSSFISHHLQSNYMAKNTGVTLRDYKNTIK